MFPSNPRHSHLLHKVSHPILAASFLHKWHKSRAAASLSALYRSRFAATVASSPMRFVLSILSLVNSARNCSMRFAAVINSERLHSVDSYSSIMQLACNRNRSTSSLSVMLCPPFLQRGLGGFAEKLTHSLVSLFCVIRCPADVNERRSPALGLVYHSISAIMLLI